MYLAGIQGTWPLLKIPYLPNIFRQTGQPRGPDQKHHSLRSDAAELGV